MTTCKLEIRNTRRVIYDSSYDLMLADWGVVNFRQWEAMIKILSEEIFEYE